MMTSAVPVMPTQTLYPMLGDFVGQGSVVGVVIAIIAVIVRRFRRAHGARPQVTTQGA